MPSLPVRLPGPVVLVPASTLDGKLRRQARDHPGLPEGLGEVESDLNARPDGVPVTFSPPQTGSGDWSLLAYTRSYVVRLYLTKKYQDAYTIGTINPLRIRDHHQLASGYLLVRSPHWQVVYDTRSIPRNSSAHWPALVACWQRLGDGLVAETGAPALTAAHAAFLDTLDRLIDADQQITTDLARSARPYPYRKKQPTGERRHGTHPVYEFQLAGGRVPEEGTFVQIRGEPEQRGQVTRVHRTVATVRFDQPLDWARIPSAGELEETPSAVVFDKQREAVGLLRTRQAANPHLLAALVDHRLQRVRRADAQPTEPLDEDQLDAFRRAVAVPDLLPVIGPPGTGKTRTISQIARACATSGGRVLVTAHANRAVDNVLSRLPRDLLAVRVGNEGSVTADGVPYLLDRQAADLRSEVVTNTARMLAQYVHSGWAGPWTEELGRRVDRLAGAVAAEAAAWAGLAAARRVIGGAAQAKVDELADARAGCERALSRQADRIDRLDRRRVRAGSRAGWPLLGALFGAVHRRCERRLAGARDEAARLQSAADEAGRQLAAAERELDAATAGDPTVAAARAAATGASRDRVAGSAAAVEAAHAALAAVGAVEPAPPAPAATEPPAALREFAELVGWLRQRLPVLAARAELLSDWHTEASGATEQLYPELVRYADVVAATCIGAASRPELSNVDYELAVVDEAGQIGTATVLVPLVRARRAVVVGDHQQLPPFLDSDVEAWGVGVGDPVVRELLAKSALELLVGGLPQDAAVLLTRQRRMPAAIADFVSAAFYQRRLRTAVQHEHRDPLFASPMAFVDTAGLPADQRREQRANRGERWGQAGYANAAEAALLVELAAFYHRLGKDWAVIVPYRAQLARIAIALTARIGDGDLVRLNVGTVDTFQGGERDVICYGFTRSNPDGKVGFLAELRRTNVAFTRAKRQLVLVGDLGTLAVARHQGFRELTLALRDHLSEHGEIRRYQEVWTRLSTLDTPAGGR